MMSQKPIATPRPETVFLGCFPLWRKANGGLTRHLAKSPRDSAPDPGMPHGFHSVLKYMLAVHGSRCGGDQMETLDEFLAVISTDHISHSSLPNEQPAAYGPTYWDSVIKKLEGKGHYLDTFLGALKRRAYLKLILRWGDVPTTGRVLKTDLFEEAIGPDAFLGDLLNRGEMTVGLDISPAAANQAKHQDTRQQGHYVIADVRALPFANDSFGLVISPSTLDHFPDPRDLGRSLRELARVLEVGGRLIITLDNRQNIFDPLLRLVSWLGYVPYYLGRSYTVREVRRELEEAGFTVDETTAILHSPRLVAVAAVALAKRLRSRLLMTLVQRMLLAAQRLETTRLCYYTGSFVAAKAVKQI